MSEMVERVAHAIYEEGVTRAAMGDHRPEALLATARAAIEAMREPGFAVCKAQTVVSPGMADLIWKQMIDAALAD